MSADPLTLLAVGSLVSSSIGAVATVRAGNDQAEALKQQRYAEEEAGRNRSDDRRRRLLDALGRSTAAAPSRGLVASGSVGSIHRADYKDFKDEEASDLTMTGLQTRLLKNRANNARTGSLLTAGSLFARGAFDYAGRGKENAGP